MNFKLEQNLNFRNLQEARVLGSESRCMAKEYLVIYLLLYIKKIGSITHKPQEVRSLPEETTEHRGCQQVKIVIASRASFIAIYCIWNQLHACCSLMCEGRAASELWSLWKSDEWTHRPGLCRRGSKFNSLALLKWL